MSDIKPAGIDTTSGSFKTVNSDVDRLMVNNVSSVGSIRIEPQEGTSEFVLLYPGDATATQPAGFTDIRGGNGYTGIQASDVYLYGGAANGSTGMAGVVNIDGGFGNATANGGIVTVGGGACDGANLIGGHVTIFGGSNNSGSAGNVGIIGGFSNAPVDQGSVVIGATYTSAVMIGATGIELGFYGMSPVNRPSVTGSRGGNAALASFLTAMASLGLIIDNTSA